MLEMFEVTDTLSSYVDDGVRSAMAEVRVRCVVTKEGPCQSTMCFPFFAVGIEYAVSHKAK